MALHTCGPIDPKEAKMVRIKNTLELERMWISEKLYEMVREDEELSKRIEIIGELEEIRFDVLGNLVR